MSLPANLYRPLLLLALPLSIPSLADDSARIQALEKQLQQQQALMQQQQQMLNQMQQEIKRLKGGQPALVQSDSSQIPTRSSTASTQATTQQIAIEKPRTSVTAYGHLQLDMIHDFNRVDPDYEATLRPSTIPTNDGRYGQDGSSLLSVRQSQMGLRGSTETPMGEVKGWFEFDMFGTGNNTGDTTFNLRHAWVEIGGLGFGQTNSTFMDISIFPNVIDWWGPSGMVFNRNPQIRYTWFGDNNEIAVALEKPNGSFNTGIFGQLSPVIDERASVRTEYPDLTSHYRSEHDWGHWQLAGVLRKLEFETTCPGDPSTCLPDNHPRTEETGWGVNLTGSINTVGQDQLKFGVVYGEGIASFMNDGGVNLAPGDNTIEAVPVLGTTLYYDRYWSNRWSSSIGVSINDADVRNQQADEEFDKGTYASVNVLYTPYPEFLIGLEALYGEHKDVGGNVGEDFRTQLTFKHKFSASF
ncbi:DcaP family trimeric outer membrane transporter [Pseudomaricurvus sp.]|uniref:DcaP family trimeric outer membrane transporter n=1 Tax=Pseudomaricurvus sp. TaxID=2004510 RepID=UPI003F6CB49C